MRYNAVTEHDDIFEVPAMLMGNKPIYIGITSLGSDGAHDGAEQWAYSVATGPWDADVQYQGEDLHGPVMAGPDGYPGPGEMAATLMAFLSAYADGDLTENPDGGDDAVDLVFDGDIIATGETAEFIHANGERLGIAAHDLEEGYLGWSEEAREVGPHGPYGTWSAFSTHSTGKEAE